MRHHVIGHEVKVDAGAAIGVVHGRIGEGDRHVLETERVRRVAVRVAGDAPAGGAGHGVDLDEDVLAVRIGVVRGLVEGQIDGAVPVGVDALRLPGVEQPIAVGIRRATTSKMCITSATLPAPSSAVTVKPVRPRHQEERLPIVDVTEQSTMPEPPSSSVQLKSTITSSPTV